jgi:multidrug resistance efflux pump
MSRSRYTKIKGTKDFLVAAVVCAFLCVWSIRDAWFPTPKILKKHPLIYEVSTPLSGVVQSVPLQVGNKISGSTVLVRLYEHTYQQEADAAEAAFNAARDNGDPDVEQKLVAMHKAKEKVVKCTIRNTDFTLNTSHGEDALYGQVLDVAVSEGQPVDAGQVLMTVRPKDAFYAFNRTLAVLSLIGAVVSLFFHRVASR